MADDHEIERWMHRRDIYLSRRVPEETRSAARAAVRIINGREVVRGAMHGIVAVRREANEIVRQDPGLELEMRELEATYFLGCRDILEWYMSR